LAGGFDRHEQQSRRDGLARARHVVVTGLAMDAANYNSRTNEHLLVAADVDNEAC
jgi:hypothetical protein